MRGLPGTVSFQQTGTLPTAPLRTAKYFSTSLAQVQGVAGLSTESVGMDIAPARTTLQ